MNLAETWTYPGGDSCCDFFSGYLKAANPDVPHDAKVLEIGCEEFNWLTPALACWPEMSFTGIDWRTSGESNKGGVRRLHGDVRDPNLFEPDAFDLIVSISAIEHVGLGHYQKDPVDVNGDTIAITNAFRWLKPGGWLLFDVPYDPTGYRVQHTECRVYNDDAVWTRLWQEPLAAAKVTARWHSTVYCHAKNTGVLLKKPTAAVNPFHYIGVGWQKVG